MLGTRAYQSLPTNGSSPTASRAQTPQPSSANGPGLSFTTGNLQQSNNSVHYLAQHSLTRWNLINKTVVSPSLVHQSRLSVDRLPTIPEETPLIAGGNNNNANRCILHDVDVTTDRADIGSCTEYGLFKSSKCAGRSLSDSESGTHFFNDDSGSAAGSSSVASSSFNRNNSSASSSSLYRGDAVLSRLSEVASRWFSALPTVPSQTSSVDALTSSKKIVLSAASTTEINHQQRVEPPATFQDANGFQIVELFALGDVDTGNSDDDIEGQLELPRRQRSVGPFNDLASGAR